MSLIFGPLNLLDLCGSSHIYATCLISDRTQCNRMFLGPKTYLGPLDNGLMKSIFQKDEKRYNKRRRVARKRCRKKMQRFALVLPRVSTWVFNPSQVFNTSRDFNLSSARFYLVSMMGMASFCAKFQNTQQQLDNTNNTYFSISVQGTSVVLGVICLKSLGHVKKILKIDFTWKKPIF